MDLGSFSKQSPEVFPYREGRHVYVSAFRVEFYFREARAKQRLAELIEADSLSLR